MKSITRNLLQPLFATALLTGSLLAEAQEYLVELLVFSQPGAQLTPAAGPGMDWDEHATALDDTVRGDIRSIDPTRHRLDSDARKLESNGYEIRFHRAWTQPADPHLSVAVREGQPMTDAGGDLLYPVQGLVSLDTDPLSARVTLWLNHATAAVPVSERLQPTRPMRQRGPVQFPCLPRHPPKMALPNILSATLVRRQAEMSVDLRPAQAGKMPAGRAHACPVPPLDVGPSQRCHLLRNTTQGTITD